MPPPRNYNPRATRQKPQSRKGRNQKHGFPSEYTVRVHEELSSETRGVNASHPPSSSSQKDSSHSNSSIVEEGTGRVTQQMPSSSLLIHVMGRPPGRLIHLLPTLLQHAARCSAAQVAVEDILGSNYHFRCLYGVCMVCVYVGLKCGFVGL